MAIIVAFSVYRLIGGESGLKGPGHEINWIKVVWQDGSWLGESPADIQKIFNCPLPPFNFILN